MPRRIQTWACEFRCGHRTTTDRKAIERHELTCFMNPARRACKTCEHERRETADYGDGNQTYTERVCTIDKLPGGKTIVFDCEFHTANAADERRKPNGKGD